MLSASILGLGLIHSIGNSEMFFSQYKSEIKESNFAGFAAIDVSILPNMLPNVSLRRVPKYAKMGLIAALNALASLNPAAQGALKNEAFQASDPASNMGLVVGSAFSGAQMNIDFMDSILDNSPHLSSPTAFSHAVNNMGAGLLSLFLNIRGGCQTITQFNLSFAGALQTALILLHSNKNEYVLLGAIDETDSRFTNTCSQYLQNTPYPLTEGAVFFLLGKNVPNTPKLSISWNDTISTTKNTMYCGDFIADTQLNNASFYGTTPLAHALDTALAVSCAVKNTVCLCKQNNIVAAIKIWR